MKVAFHGTNGHIGFFVNSVERAVYQLKNRGCTVIQETKRFDAKGRMQSVYLEDEINGFAVHIVRK